MPNVQEFIAEVTKSGLAKTNKFHIEILPGSSGDVNLPVPRKYRDILGNISAGEIPRRLRLFAQNVDTPSRVMPTFNTPFRDFPYEITYEPVSITFKLSGNAIEKKALDLWQMFVIDPESEYIEYQDAYARDIIIKMFDEQDNEIYSITLFDAYPTSAAPLSLDHSSQNEFALVSYTFTYRRWAFTQTSNESGEPQSTSLFGQIKQNGTDAIAAISQGDVGSLKAPINDTLKTTKGLLDLDQGETLNYYNKLSSVVEEYSGVSINEGRRFVESVKGDIDSIEDTDILSSGNKAVLSAGAADVLGILG